MITFDFVTRQFSVVEDREFGMPGYWGSAAIGAAGNWAYGTYKRKKTAEKLREQGMSNDEAEKEARRRHGSASHDLTQGVGLGIGTRFVGGRIRDAYSHLPKVPKTITVPGIPKIQVRK